MPSNSNSLIILDTLTNPVGWRATCVLQIIHYTIFQGFLVKNS